MPPIFYCWFLPLRFILFYDFYILIFIFLVIQFSASFTLPPARGPIKVINLHVSFRLPSLFRLHPQPGNTHDYVIVFRQYIHKRSPFSVKMFWTPSSLAEFSQRAHHLFFLCFHQKFWTKNQKSNIAFPHRIQYNVYVYGNFVVKKLRFTASFSSFCRNHIHFSAFRAFYLGLSVESAE